MSSLEISKHQIYFKQLFQLKVAQLSAISVAQLDSHLKTYYKEKP